MKKILFLLSIMVLLASCQNELSMDMPQEGAENDKVTMTFSVNIPDAPEATRSFSEPAIRNLYLIVFDNNGYFAEKCAATPVNGWSVSSEVPTEFKVSLTASASKRVIHFIANYEGPEQLAFGAESDIIGNMIHQNGADAYWQRLELVGGINESTDMGTVPLIRNHAKITVVSEETQFTLIGFTVVNTLTEGYVSPYNKNTGTFAKFIEEENGAFKQTNGKYVCREYADITAGRQGYEGYVPGTSAMNLNTDVPANYTDDPTAWTPQNGAFYMYERSHEANNHTFLILYGSYGKAANTYYKVDMTKTVAGRTSYYNILRNFEYKVVITDVTGNGKKSAAEAYSMIGAHNNLTASVETQSLTNISDGKQQLFVEYTEEYIVSDNDVTLKYKYVPDVANKAATRNDQVQFIWDTDGDVISAITPSTAAGIATDEDGWSTIRITTKAIDANETKKQTLTLVSVHPDNGTTLTRMVTYILRNPYPLSIKCYDGESGNKKDKVVKEEVNAPVHVDISLPANLPESLFPLQMFIEAEKRTLYPDASKQPLPVEPELPSKFDSKPNTTTFAYVYEISWEDYKSTTTDNATGTKTFTAMLQTNTTANASRICVYNKYFNSAFDFFSNTQSGRLVSDDYYDAGHNVTLTFTPEFTGEYTITPTNMVESAVTKAITSTLNAGETYTFNFTTTTWNGVPEVLISSENGEYEEYVIGTVPHILSMKANNATGDELYDNTTLSIYDSETKTNLLATVNKATLLNNRTDIDKAGLLEDTYLWFVYETTDYEYRASAKAGDLSNGTAQLVFDKYEKPVVISAEFGDGTQYYGVGKTFPLNITVDKACTITIAENEVLTFSKTTINATTYSVTCTTKTWNTPATATITATTASGQATTLTVNGATRNVLLIKTSNSNYNGSTTFKISTSKINRNNWSSATSAENSTPTQGIEFGIDGLVENNTYYLAYRSGNTYYNCSTTAKNFATEDVSLTFSR